MRVTEKMAEKVLQAVKTQFAEYTEGGNLPELILHYEGEIHAIVWESGPHEWAYNFPEAATNWEHVGVLVSEFNVPREEAIAKCTVPAVKLPKGVWTQAYNTCVVGIFRD